MKAGRLGRSGNGHSRSFSFEKFKSIALNDDKYPTIGVTSITVDTHFMYNTE